MKSIQLKVKNQVGLHARPATLFVQAAQKYTSDIKVMHDGVTVNAKSMLALLSLGVTKGSVITIFADGEDEQIALDALITLVENNFGE